MSNILMIDFRCAETGKPFAVRFEREPSDGKFRAVQIIRKHDDPRPARCLPASRGDKQEIDVSQVHDSSWARLRCPWCSYRNPDGAPLFAFECDKCCEYVCCARLRKGADIGGFGIVHFRCHDGCGQETWGVGMSARKVAADVQAWQGIPSGSRKELSVHAIPQTAAVRRR